VWPPEALLPGWRAVMQAYFDACAALGMRLTRLLGDALGTPAGFFDEPGRFDAPQLFLRLLRYAPEASAPGEGVFGAGAHTDYGMITLLATDEHAGLQIQPRAGADDANDAADDGAGAWYDVAPRRGAFIVNLGDMLERWTNGAFRSTRHRVVTRPHGQQRFSIPFFFGALSCALLRARGMPV
jgi:isopenicillin N synthase-like dioxygenase